MISTIKDAIFGTFYLVNKKDFSGSPILCNFQDCGWAYSSLFVNTERLKSVDNKASSFVILKMILKSNEF